MASGNTNGTLESAVKEGVILGMGNPLLDISANIKPDFLEKYNVKANDAILAEDKHMPLYKDIADNYDVEYTAGGATQNSIRVAQWMLQAKGPTSYFGAIGSDKFGKTMTDCCLKDGVKTQYFTNNDVTTGVCAVLVSDNGKSRSLVTDLKAANTYPLSHLKEKAQWSVVEKASIFYMAGFFLTVSPESITTIGEHVLKENKTLCMNLSAPFLLEVPPFFESFKKVLPYVDIYFSNETEARTLSKVMKWDTEDVKEIAVRFTKLGKLSARPRTVVITQGENPTVIAVGDESRLWSMNEYPVIPIKADKIVDTNGAGDAFVGGFLCGMAQGVCINDCVKRGNYAANVIIQRAGCTFPDKPSFT